MAPDRLTERLQNRPVSGFCGVNLGTVCNGFAQVA